MALTVLFMFTKDWSEMRDDPACTSREVKPVGVDGVVPEWYMVRLSNVEYGVVRVAAGQRTGVDVPPSEAALKTLEYQPQANAQPNGLPIFTKATLVYWIT